MSSRLESVITKKQKSMIAKWKKYKMTEVSHRMKMGLLLKSRFCVSAVIEKGEEHG